MIQQKEWQKLADKYLQTEEKQTQNVNVWDKKSELSSSSEEKLLNTPELLKLYISKYRLYSSSTKQKLLNTPELVKLYISRYGVSDSIREIIQNKIKNERTRKYYEGIYKITKDGNVDTETKINMLHEIIIHCEKDMKYNEVNSEIFQNALANWRKTQEKIQKLRGFEIDKSKWCEYKLPKCECPKLDNDDVGCHMFFNVECPIHGNSLK